VVPDVAEQIALVAQLRSRARRIVEGRLDRERSWLDGMRSRPVLADPVREVDRRQEQVTALAERARRCLGASLSRADDDIGHLRARLLALAPSATLRRGYAIVQRRDGTVVRQAADVAAGERLTLRFADDQLAVHAVERAAPAKAAPGKKAPAKAAPAKAAPGKKTPAKARPATKAPTAKAPATTAQPPGSGRAGRETDGG
jgi:exodeoxyribonuclease VII large subunit